MVMDVIRSRKWLAALLLLSLAGNIFLGGLYAGAWLDDGEPDEPAIVADGQGHQTDDGPGQRLIRRMAAALPDAERAGFEASIAAERPKLVAAGLALQESRLKVRAAIKSEPFDRATLDAAMADMRQRFVAFQEAQHMAVSGAIEKLSPEARRRLAEMEWRRGGRGNR